MSVPVGIYKVELYKNDQFIGIQNWKCPLRASTSAENYMVSNDANLETGTNSVFGSFLPVIYKAVGLPPSQYAQITVADGLNMQLTGIDVSNFTTSDVLYFYINKAENFGIKWKPTSSTYGSFCYFRGTWESGWYSRLTCSVQYTTLWGQFYGVLENADGIPLPDFSALETAAGSNTQCWVYQHYTGRCIYKTQSGLPACNPEMGQVTANTFTAMSKNDIITWLGGYEPKIPDPNDPYDFIDPSEPSGPAEADGIPDDAEVDFPTVPSVSASDTGFVTLYNPTLSQVKDLADYMWTGLFDLATYKKLFADPMDCILGFNMLPVTIPHGTAKSVTVGNINTGVSMNPATSQWIEVDCGSINMGDAFGSYLSYAPYTKISIYLPYIGTVELSTDDLIGKTVSLKYHIDCLSCSCVAYLKCGTSVLYQFTGSCGYSIPVNGNDFRTTISNIASIAASVAGAAATGGMSAPISAAGAIRAGATIAQNVVNSKPEIHRSGAIGSAAGIMGLQKPYLIVEYPNPCKPKKQYHYIGYPSFVTVTLGDLTGFASFENVILSGISCTDEERQIILGMCQEGIYL